MAWQRPNIGSRVNREVHARFWERLEVKFLRATRPLLHSRHRNNSVAFGAKRTSVGTGAEWIGSDCRVGPGNFTLSLSQIPDVILSHHPARAIARRLLPSAETSGSSPGHPPRPN